jgi:hypothetical protein
MGVVTRIEALDISLFAQIETQLGPEDKHSLLALHSAWRFAYGSFAYLEIGSHLGGSLQALIRDPACTAIISIDSRPQAQPDERGIRYEYAGNSTQRMLDELQRLPEANLAKLTTIDASTTTLDPGGISPRPCACLVDGEHTDAAALRDARFCRAALGDEGCIAFHDAQVVYRSLARFLEELEQDGVEHRAYFLPNTVFAIELGPSRLIEAPQLAGAVLGNAGGYLTSLLANDVYRDWYARSMQRRAREAARAMRRRIRQTRSKR